jgi:hypothetical protein
MSAGAARVDSRALGKRGDSRVAVLDHLPGSHARAVPSSARDHPGEPRPGRSSGRRAGEALVPSAADTAAGRGVGIVPADEALAMVVVETSGSRSSLRRRPHVDEGRRSRVVYSPPHSSPARGVGGRRIHVRLIEGENSQHVYRRSSRRWALPSLALAHLRRRSSCRRGRPNRSRSRSSSRVRRTTRRFGSATSSSSRVSSGSATDEGALAGVGVAERPSRSCAIWARSSNRRERSRELIKTTVFLMDLDDFGAMNGAVRPVCRRSPTALDRPISGLERRHHRDRSSRAPLTSCRPDERRTAIRPRSNRLQGSCATRISAS